MIAYGNVYHQNENTLGIIKTSICLLALGKPPWKLKVRQNTNTSKAYYTITNTASRHLAMTLNKKRKHSSFNGNPLTTANTCK